MPFSTTVAAPSSPDTLTLPDVVGSVEMWLQAQPRPELAVRWRSGGANVMVRDAAHLGSLVGALPAVGRFGVVETPSSRWAQTMRADGGYVAEVNGVVGPDCFARRVWRGGARVDGADLFASSAEVARFLWAWVHASLLPGYALEPVDERHHR